MILSRFATGRNRNDPRTWLLDTAPLLELPFFAFFAFFCGYFFSEKARSLLHAIKRLLQNLDVARVV